MTTGRDSMLERIRQAVAEGNRAGAIPVLPGRNKVGSQPQVSDPVKRFCDAVAVSGATAHVAEDASAAAKCALDLVVAKSAKRVLVGRGQVLDQLKLSESLRHHGIDFEIVDNITSTRQVDVFFRADLGISGVTWAIAETGSVVMASSPHDPRSLSLLPPIHIAVVGRHQLVPDLFDMFNGLEPTKAHLPSCLSVITGPSKTGDIELKLVTGVHGPGELHVIVIASQADLPLT